MTPLKGPGDPGYDANVLQMAKIRAEQGPEAWKTDLDDATIAKLEDCMNEKEVMESQDFIKNLEKTIDDELASGRKGSVDREKVRKGFKDSFTAMTDQELLDTLKNEKKKQGWCFARMNYLGLMREEIGKRGII